MILDCKNVTMAHIPKFGLPALKKEEVILMVSLQYFSNCAQISLGSFFDNHQTEACSIGINQFPHSMKRSHINNACIEHSFLLITARQ